MYDSHTDAADDDNDHPSIVANPLLLCVLLCAVATAVLPLLPLFSIEYVLAYQRSAMGFLFAIIFV